MTVSQQRERRYFEAPSSKPTINGGLIADYAISWRVKIRLYRLDICQY